MRLSAKRQFRKTMSWAAGTSSEMSTSLASDRSVRQPITVDLNHHRRWIERIAFAFVVAYVAFLAASFARGVWLMDARGHGIPTDFVNVWAAGRLVLDGKAPDAFDWPIHKAVEEQAVGHPFDKYFGWHYPPTFLFAAAALSLLPYVGSFFIWMALTLPAYVAVIRII